MEKVSVFVEGYGAYIPRYRIPSSEIARVWGYAGALPVKEKAVAGLDEDSITMAVEAARYALRRAGISGEELGAVYVGTESKPYAVKPCATIVAECLGATPKVRAADIEFACKAGTEALNACYGLVKSEEVDHAMAIGVDTAQAQPSDALEYTAASGAACLIVGKEKGVARIEGCASYVTDTPDFWRRERSPYPKHLARFTGAPAYFAHIIGAAKELMEKLGLEPKDFDFAVFHQPNVKFPLKVGKMLGFEESKIKPGLLSGEIGNIYAGSSLLGLCRVFDEAEPGQRILLVSYGSGAGSDAYSFVVEEDIRERRNLAPSVEDLIRRRKEVDYATYARYRRILRW